MRAGIGSEPFGIHPHRGRGFDRVFRARWAGDAKTNRPLASEKHLGYETQMLVTPRDRESRIDLSTVYGFDRTSGAHRALSFLSAHGGATENEPS